MKITIHDISSEGLSREFEAAASAFPNLSAPVADGECEFVGPLRVGLRVDPSGEMFRVAGRFEADVKLTCARCLETFETTLSDEFDVHYSSEPIDADLATDEGDVELHAEDMGVIHYTGEAIDLTLAVQDQVLMALPFKPLCREDCKGLCPQCGANLNAAPCGCDDARKDSPFYVLKGLKDKL